MPFAAIKKSSKQAFHLNISPSQNPSCCFENWHLLVVSHGCTIWTSIARHGAIGACHALETAGNLRSGMSTVGDPTNTLDICMCVCMCIHESVYIRIKSDVLWKKSPLINIYTYSVQTRTTNGFGVFATENPNYRLSLKPPPLGETWRMPC